MEPSEQEEQIEIPTSPTDEVRAGHEVAPTSEEAATLPDVPSVPQDETAPEELPEPAPPSSQRSLASTGAKLRAI